MERFIISFENTSFAYNRFKHFRDGMAWQLLKLTHIQIEDQREKRLATSNKCFVLAHKLAKCVIQGLRAKRCNRFQMKPSLMFLAIFRTFWEMYYDSLRSI